VDVGDLAINDFQTAIHELKSKAAEPNLGAAAFSCFIIAGACHGICFSI
jgi:hypothetical protein